MWLNGEKLIKVKNKFTDKWNEKTETRSIRANEEAPDKR